MNSRTELDKLALLILEERCLIRNIDVYFHNNEIKHKLFVRLEEVKKDIRRTKFKLKMERELAKK